jgi:hypothetical protein
VNAHLVAAQTHANSIADNFWADRTKMMKLTLLQDRIAQAGVLTEKSRSALTLVHQVMFPLNYQPEGLRHCSIDSRMETLCIPLSRSTCAAELWSHLLSCVLTILRSTWSF